MNEFSDANKGGLLVKSPRAQATQDIMNKGDLWHDHAAGPSLSADEVDSSGVAAAEPGFGADQDTFVQDLVEHAQATREETLMETMYADNAKSGAYEAPDVDLNDFARDITHPITDGQSMAEQYNRQRGMQEESIKNFKSDWKQAKREAAGAFEESAKSMGVDAGAAAMQMFPGPSSSDEVAIAGAAVCANGGGSLATFMTGSCAAVELGTVDKQKLSVEQQKSLLQDTMKRLQDSNNQVDTRASGGGSADVPDESDVAWENMEMDDLAEFLAADPEGEDQDEMIALRDSEHKLDLVADMFDYYMEHSPDFVNQAKIEAVASTGNSAMQHVVAEAEVATVAAINYDDVAQSRMSMAGMSLSSGIEVSASEMKSAKSISTVFDMKNVDLGLASQQIDADLRNQFSAGGFS